MSANSSALVKRSADSSLMLPPPPPKRIKRPATVLDEDTYTGALSHIIARDFFPGLLESGVQQEYLDAVESKDKAWISEAGRRLTEVMTPRPEGRNHRGRRGVSMTPTVQRPDGTPVQWPGNTPNPDLENKEDTKTTVDINLSLGGFQSKYTSEDNESFNELLDKQNAKNAEKHSWLYHGNKIPAARQIAYRERQARMLEASKDKAPEMRIIKRAPNLNDRPAMPEIRASEPRNAFMFDPDGIEDQYVTTMQAAEERSYAPPKAVVFDNTRLPNPMANNENAIPPSPSLSAINDALSGRPRPSASETGYDGSETPRVNGYAFVDEEPTPAELGETSAASPSSSQDDQEDLLRLLAATADASPNPFHLKASSRREGLHHAMVEKNSKGKRASTVVDRLEALKSGPGTAAATGRTPTPKFLSATPRAKAGGLTPAAQSLLGKVGTPVRASVMNDVFGRSKDSGRWTPKVSLTPRTQKNSK